MGNELDEAYKKIRKEYNRLLNSLNQQGNYFQKQDVHYGIEAGLQMAMEIINEIQKE